MFKLMKADQDAGGGPGYWRTYLASAFKHAADGRATPSLTSPGSTYRPSCSSATAIARG